MPRSLGSARDDRAFAEMQSSGLETHKPSPLRKVPQKIADATGVIDLDAEEHPILSRILNGKSLGDVYQLGMSMADSGAVALLSPILGSGGTALLGAARRPRASLTRWKPGPATPRL